MTMHTVFFKENEGFVPNPTNVTLSEVPRWSGLGSPPPPAVATAAYGNPFVQSKLTSLDLSTGGNQLGVAKDREDEQGLGKGITTQFTLFSDYDLGDCTSDENGAKTNLQTVPSSIQAATMEDHQGHFKFEFGQPLVYAQYPYGDQQCYGVYSTYGTQIAGRMMLPMSLASDGAPIFVNAKQYNAIMRRRKSRAKGEMANQVLKSRKPYQHFSRHLHAKRRARGNGGRFLNTKNSKASKKDTDKEENQHPQSEISEVVESDGVINYKGKNSSMWNTSPGSEVTSHFSTIHPFQINHLSLGIAMTGGNYLKV